LVGERRLIHGLEEKKRLGWVCTYTPEEIILTLGLESYRLYGAEENQSGCGCGEAAQDYLPVNFCPLTRACLNEGARKLRFSLTGVVLTTSCQGLVHLYNGLRYSFRRQEKRVFTYLLDVPRNRTSKKEAALLNFSSSLRALVRQLCRFYGVEWSQNAYLRALHSQRRIRFLLRELYRFQREHPGQVRATGVLEVVRAASRTPKEQFYPVLSSALRLLKGEISAPLEPEPGASHLVEKLRPRKSLQGPRIFLAGNPLPLSYVDLLEDLGGIVVGDDFCQGYRYCLPEIEEDGGLVSLARGYLERVPCPRMLAGSERLAYLLNLVKKCGAQGMIYHALKFCDFSLYEYASMRNFFLKAGIPVLYLETDYRSGGLEQARTRLQAFLEMLG